MPAELFLPTTLGDTVALLERYGDEVVILAGGTVVMRLVHDGALIRRAAVSLSRLGLSGIERDNGSLRIGACTTIAQLAALGDASALGAAAATIGGPALRTTATIGGNLFARAPYGDLAVALLALGATVEMTGSGGSSELALEDFLVHRPPGIVVTGLRVSAEVAPAIFLKLGRRRGNATTVVAAAIKLGAGGPSVALGGAFEQPRRSAAAEQALAGGALGEERIAAAAAAAAEEADPPTDAVASSWYRRKMVAVVVRRALESLAGGEGDHR